MHSRRHALIAWLIAPVLAFASHAGGQGLVPLGDDVEHPLLPSTISRDVVELGGQFAWLWTKPDGVRVIQYRGSFQLVTGARRMTAEEAVVWVHRDMWEGKPFYRYEVFLSRNARLIESAGTLTSGPMLFVTFNSFEPPEVRVDASTRESSAQTEAFLEGSRIRDSVLRNAPTTTQPTGMQVVPFEAGPATAPAAKPLVQYRADHQTYDRDRNVVTADGNVYVTQGLLDSADFIEARADAAVLFLGEKARLDRLAEIEQAKSKSNGAAKTGPPKAGSGFAEPSGGDAESPFGGRLGEFVTGVYLEGNVVLSQGERMIRASRLYYDFEQNRALFLDAVFRGFVPERDLPIYVRAAAIRQLSTTEFEATQANISSSPFHTPHVQIGADKVLLYDRTPRDESGRVTGVLAGRYEAYGPTFKLEDVPILYWPYTQGDFRQTENLLRGARFGYSGDRGVYAETKWQLFNLLGLRTPEGFDAALRLDWMTERGPGIGTDIDYKTEDYYGLFRGYYIHDEGEDELGPFRSGKPDTENRGRVTWRHRQFLPEDWELTLELSYLSDPHFLEEYFQREFDTEKEQESLVYLKKQRDNWAFTLLSQWRLNDFLTQTEHLPDIGFNWIGEPIGEFASIFSESHAGYARYRPDHRRFFDSHRADNTEPSDLTFRAVTRDEIDVPIKLGPVNVVPYAAGRLGRWDGTPFDGSVTQDYGSVGMRTGTQLWRLDEDVRSRLLDLNGIRHVIKPEITAWLAAANRESFDLHPFDPGIEDADDFSGASFAVRQRWQTKRGGPGRWRVVDWVTWDIEANIFDNAPHGEQPTGHFYDSRPENSIARNHVRSNMSYRLSDTTAIFTDLNWDLNDGDLDRFNVSYAVERTPRFSYFVGYRRIHETDSNLFGVGANYQINSKHTVAVRELFDLDRGETATFDVILIRRFPGWYAALELGLDDINNNVDLSVTVWPEGLPEAAIGTKRYTGLATSTGINAQTD